MQNELIKITTTEDGKQLVSAKELYLGLGLNKSNWSRWYVTNIQKNEFFDESVDWTGVRHDDEANETMDFAITIEMAKHLAMMAKTKKSHEYRNYFLSCEKELKQQLQQPQLPTDYLSALKALVASEEEKQKLKANNDKLLIENNDQKTLIEELQPKANYSDTVLRSPSLVTVTQIAKDYGMSAVAFNKLLKDLGIQFKRGGQWFLTFKYHANGWTQSETFVKCNGDSKLSTKWTQAGRLGLYNILKDNNILPLIEQNQEEFDDEEDLENIKDEFEDAVK